MLVSDQTFWLVAFAMYSFDCFKLIEQDELVLNEQYDGSLDLTISPAPYILKNKCLILLNPLTPFLMDFKITFNTAEVSSLKQIYDDMFLIKQLKSNVLVLRAMTMTSFILLFIMGPILTNFIGLYLCLIYLIPIHLGIYILMMIFCFSKPNTLPLKPSIPLALELLICPMYLPTILKRISLSLPLSSSGNEFVDTFLPNESVEYFHYALEARINDQD